MPTVAGAQARGLLLGSCPVDDEHGGSGVRQRLGEHATQRAGAPGDDRRAAAEGVAHQDPSIHGSRTSPAVTRASMSRNSKSSSMENAWASGISTPA